MTAAVLDASALLAYLFGEPGSDAVEESLLAGSACCAVNYSEVIQKIQSAGVDWNTAVGVLDAMGLDVLDATATDAVAAAELWKSGSSLSLADRFCLATAKRLAVPVLTADRAWGESESVRQIR
ncbi:MAG: type II toxin-antitoxin system VapC family toxin [Micropruina sp.]